MSLFAICAAFFGWLAVSAPPWLILVVERCLGVFPWQWDIWNVQVDQSDIAFAALALAVFLRSGPKRERTSKLRLYLGLWAAYGVLISLAYLITPANQENLTRPVAVAYQLYRYCWKPILYYLLAILFLGEERPRTAFVLAVLFAADICAIAAIGQGYRGDVVVGTLGENGQKNAVASMMLIPMLLSLMGWADPRSRRLSVFYLFSGALAARAVLISGSRSAFVAALVAGGMLLWGTWRMPTVRPRVRQLVVMATLLLALLFVLKPGLRDRPALQKTLTAAQLTEDDNFRWRLEQRWPHFWEMTLDHPWLGNGTDVDLSLGESGNTPHNGYLSVAVTYGIPAAFLFAFFIVSGIRDGLRAYRMGRTPQSRLLGITVAAGITGVAVNNIVETSINDPSVSALFWTLVAVGAVEARRTAPERSNPRTAVAAEGAWAPETMHDRWELRGGDMEQAHVPSSE